MVIRYRNLYSDIQAISNSNNRTSILSSSSSLATTLADPSFSQNQNQHQNPTISISSGIVTSNSNESSSSSSILNVNQQIINSFDNVMNDFAINNDHHFSSPSIANLHFFDDDDDDENAEADKQQQTNSNRMYFIYFIDENQTKTNVQHTYLSSSS